MAQSVNLATGSSMHPPFPPGTARVVLGGGCFWGVEEIFWQVPGVVTTAVGYAGGTAPHPDYQLVCTGTTGHAEAVLVVYRPDELAFDDLVVAFLEVHDPTQGMRQGNDVGSQYRSAIYTETAAEAARATELAQAYAPVLAAEGYGPVTTEIAPLAEVGDGVFHYAEDYHQQYLLKNPNGYRCHAATGIAYPRVS